MMAVQPCVTTVLGPERWARGAGEGQAGWRGGWVRLGGGCLPRAASRLVSRLRGGTGWRDARRERGRTGEALEFGEDEHHRRGADVTEVGVPELGEDPRGDADHRAHQGVREGKHASLESRAARGVDAPGARARVETVILGAHARIRTRRGSHLVARRVTSVQARGVK